MAKKPGKTQKENPVKKVKGMVIDEKETREGYREDKMKTDCISVWRFQMRFQRSEMHFSASRLMGSLKFFAGGNDPRHASNDQGITFLNRKINRHN